MSKRFRLSIISFLIGASLTSGDCAEIPLAECQENAYLFRESISEASFAKQVNDDDTSAPYVRNPYIPEDLWITLSPYFFPENFPEKIALDRIFAKRRVLTSKKSMRRAGFMILTDSDKIIVAKHAKLPGYLVKVYLDTSDAIDWTWWKKRIDGAHLIQEAINRHGYQEMMKTPHKWMYPLPPGPDAKEGTLRKNFILVVEEMDILGPKRNRKAYKSKMTPAILDALYTLIMENLLIDSVYADNVPFCEDGRLAFIDTEHARDTTQPVPIASVAQYLSPEMYAYWEQLIVHGIH